jgi:uncharacterized protein
MGVADCGRDRVSAHAATPRELHELREGRDCSAEPGETISVRVLHCPGPGVADEVVLRLAPSATVRGALQASGLQARHASIDLRRVGVWGRARQLDDGLHDGDRVELYRPLRVDPKEARRLRYRGQRAKAARR